MATLAVGRPSVTTSGLGRAARRIALVVAALVIGAVVTVALARFALNNAGSILWQMPWALQGAPGSDWTNLADLSLARPYADEAFRWSPLAAWLWVTVVLSVGYGIWCALHLAALASLRDWRFALLVAVSSPFWMDLANGNILTLVLGLAWLALAGNRAAVIAYCVLAALVPRPLMVPVLAYLLVTRRDARWAFAVALVVILAHAAAVGQLAPYIDRLVNSGDQLAAPFNVGPSHYFGTAWIPVGVALAALATWRGYFGLASVLISPYLFEYYLLMLALELRPNGPLALFAGRHSPHWGGQEARTRKQLKVDIASTEVAEPAFVVVGKHSRTLR